MSKTIRNHPKLALVLIGLLLLSTTLTIAYSIAQNGLQKQTLDVKIYPREIKLIFGQSQLFQVVSYNGTPPYTIEWYSNRTYIGEGITLDFSFTEPCHYIILSVKVRDQQGIMGQDSVFVYDPVTFPTIIEAGSMVSTASYIIFVEVPERFSRLR